MASKNRGGFHPLELLHETQLWKKIFDNLKDPNDLKSCAQVCPYFKDDLQSKRTSFLFEEVLGIMEKQSLVSTKDYLNCRLVSKTWLLSVNRVLQKLPHFDMFDFSTPEEMDVFRSKYVTVDGTASSNTIFSKSVSIWQPVNEAMNMEHPFDEILGNMRAAPNILQVFGTQITNMYLQMFQLYVSLEVAEEMYPLFQNMLTLLPNLEYFEFDYVVMNPHTYWSKRYKYRHLQPTSSIQLKKLISDHPLPEMRQLKKLAMFSTSLSEDILLELLRKCPRLETLQDSNRSGVGNIGILSKIGMRISEEIDQPYLKEFKGAFCGRLDFLTICDLRWPNLQVLNLFIARPIIPNDILNLDTIFKVLEYHKISLKEVSLFLKSGSVDFWDTKFSKNHKYKYDLPKLETFHFKYEDAMPLEFLLPMKPSLKILCLWPEKSASGMLEKEPEKAKLKIYSCWNNMYDSNIWNIFPLLETVELKSSSPRLPTDNRNVIRPPITKRYTRQIYKRRIGEEVGGSGKTAEKNYWHKFLTLVRKFRRSSTTAVAEVINFVD